MTGKRWDNREKTTQRKTWFLEVTEQRQLGNLHLFEGVLMVSGPHKILDTSQSATSQCSTGTSLWALLGVIQTFFFSCGQNLVQESELPQKTSSPCVGKALGLQVMERWLIPAGKPFPFQSARSQGCSPHKNPGSC